MNRQVLHSHCLFYQGVKNEAENYMLKELSLLKWQEKATKLASEKNVAEVAELQETVSNLEANLKTERCFLLGTNLPQIANWTSDDVCYL